MKLINNIQQYIKYYDEIQLIDKLGVIGKKIGSKVIYYILILVILISDNRIPFKVRLVFMAAIGYLILPTDLVADMLPVVGFADDIAFLTYTITNAREYITPEVLDKAKERMGSWANSETRDSDADK